MTHDTSERFKITFVLQTSSFKDTRIIGAIFSNLETLANGAVFRTIEAKAVYVKTRAHARDGNFAKYFRVAKGKGYCAGARACK